MTGLSQDLVNVFRFLNDNFVFRGHGCENFSIDVELSLLTFINLVDESLVIGKNNGS